MLVSIAITNYNYAPYLREAIDSALGQTYPNVEVVVVDDGSTDHSAEVIRSYDDRIVAVFQENGGFCSAMNAALARSRGGLVCLLDADDVFEPDKVERVVTVAERRPDAYLIHHQFLVTDAAGTPLFPPAPRWIPDGDIRAAVMGAGGWFPHAPTSSLSFRREYFERLLPMPTRHHVGSGTDTKTIPVFPDAYMAAPAALLAPVARISAPLTRGRCHEGSMLFGISSADAIVRFLAERDAAQDVMRNTFGQPLELRMEGHLEYQLRRCAMRELSRPRAAAKAMQSRPLPATVRMREALRVFANRGSAARNLKSGNI